MVSYSDFFSPLCFWLRSSGIAMCCIIYLGSPEPVHCCSEVFLGEGGFVSMRTGFMWYCLGSSVACLPNCYWEHLDNSLTARGKGKEM